MKKQRVGCINLYSTANTNFWPSQPLATWRLPRRKLSAGQPTVDSVDRMHDEDVWPYSIPKTGKQVTDQQSGSDTPAEAAYTSGCSTGQGLQAQLNLSCGKHIWVSPGMRQAICLQLRSCHLQAAGHSRRCSKWGQVPKRGSRSAPQRARCFHGVRARTACQQDTYWSTTHCQLGQPSAPA